MYRYGFIEIHFPVERLFYLHIRIHTLSLLNTRYATALKRNGYCEIQDPIFVECGGLYLSAVMLSEVSSYLFQSEFNKKILVSS